MIVLYPNPKMIVFIAHITLVRGQKPLQFDWRRVDGVEVHQVSVEYRLISGDLRGQVHVQKLIVYHNINIKRDRY